MTTASPAPLLHLSQRDEAGLRWLKDRARFWITALKRRRKYLPKCGYSEEEIQVLRALIALEQAAGNLLELTIPRTGGRAAGDPTRGSLTPAA